jgi:hypothetical protein
MLWQGDGRLCCLVVVILIQIENLEGKTMVVFLILMNTSSIMSTKFVCVRSQWSP